MSAVTEAGNASHITDEPTAMAQNGADFLDTDVGSEGMGQDAEENDAMPLDLKDASKEASATQNNVDEIPETAAVTHKLDIVDNPTAREILADSTNESHTDVSSLENDHVLNTSSESTDNADVTLSTNDVVVNGDTIEAYASANVSDANNSAPSGVTQDDLLKVNIVPDVPTPIVPLETSTSSVPTVLTAADETDSDDGAAAVEIVPAAPEVLSGFEAEDVAPEFVPIPPVQEESHSSVILAEDGTVVSAVDSEAAIHLEDAAAVEDILLNAVPGQSDVTGQDASLQEDRIDQPSSSQSQATLEVVNNVDATTEPSSVSDAGPVLDLDASRDADQHSHQTGPESTPEVVVGLPDSSIISSDESNEQDTPAYVESADDSTTPAIVDSLLDNFIADDETAPSSATDNSVVTETPVEPPSPDAGEPDLIVDQSQGSPEEPVEQDSVLYTGAAETVVDENTKAPFADDDDAELSSRLLAAHSTEVERPKSPWTPSYSVITQGPGISTPDEEEIAELSLLPPPVNVVDTTEGLEEFSESFTMPALPQTEPIYVTVSESDDVEAGIAPPVDSPRPNSPWTPSYSVVVQGSPLSPTVDLIAQDEDRVSNDAHNEEDTPDDLPPKSEVAPLSPAVDPIAQDGDISNDAHNEENASNDLPPISEVAKDEESRDPSVAALIESGVIVDPSTLQDPDVEDDSPDADSEAVVAALIESGVLTNQPTQDDAVPDSVLAERAEDDSPLEDLSSSTSALDFISESEISTAKAEEPVDLPSLAAQPEVATDTAELMGEVPVIETFLAATTLVPDRPKSPWTPSYSVSQQGWPSSKGEPDVLATPSDLDVFSTLLQLAVDVSSLDASLDPPRSSSPWTPSYSVSVQGSPFPTSTELAESTVEVDDMVAVDEIQQSAAETMPVPAEVVGEVASEINTALRQPAVDVSSLDVSLDPPRSSSPWTLSYSVSVQGSPLPTSTDLAELEVEVDDMVAVDEIQQSATEAIPVPTEEVGEFASEINTESTPIAEAIATADEQSPNANVAEDVVEDVASSVVPELETESSTLPKEVEEESIVADLPPPTLGAATMDGVTTVAVDSGPGLETVATESSPTPLPTEATSNVVAEPTVAEVTSIEEVASIEEDSTTALDSVAEGSPELVIAGPPSAAEEVPSQAASLEDVDAVDQAVVAGGDAPVIVRQEEVPKSTSAPVQETGETVAELLRVEAVPDAEAVIVHEKAVGAVAVDEIVSEPPVTEPTSALEDVLVQKAVATAHDVVDTVAVDGSAPVQETGDSPAEVIAEAPIAETIIVYENSNEQAVDAEAVDAEAVDAAVVNDVVSEPTLAEPVLEQPQRQKIFQFEKLMPLRKFQETEEITTEVDVEVPIEEAVIVYEKAADAVVVDDIVSEPTSAPEDVTNTTADEVVDTVAVDEASDLDPKPAATESAPPPVEKVDTAVAAEPTSAPQDVLVQETDATAHGVVDTAAVDGLDAQFVATEFSTSAPVQETGDSTPELTAEASVKVAVIVHESFNEQVVDAAAVDAVDDVVPEPAVAEPALEPTSALEDVPVREIDATAEVLEVVAVDDEFVATEISAAAPVQEMGEITTEVVDDIVSEPRVKEPTSAPEDVTDITADEVVDTVAVDEASDLNPKPVPTESETPPVEEADTAVAVEVVDDSVVPEAGSQAAEITSDVVAESLAGEAATNAVHEVACIASALESVTPELAAAQEVVDSGADEPQLVPEQPAPTEQDLSTITSESPASPVANSALIEESQVDAAPAEVVITAPVDEDTFAKEIVDATVLDESPVPEPTSALEDEVAEPTQEYATVADDSLAPESAATESTPAIVEEGVSDVAAEPVAVESVLDEGFLDVKDAPESAVTESDPAPEEEVPSELVAEPALTPAAVALMVEEMSADDVSVDAAAVDVAEPVVPESMVAPSVSADAVPAMSEAGDTTDLAGASEVAESMPPAPEVANASVVDSDSPADIVSEADGEQNEANVTKESESTETVDSISDSASVPVQVITTADETALMETGLAPAPDQEVKDVESIVPAPEAVNVSGDVPVATDSDSPEVTVEEAEPATTGESFVVVEDSVPPTTAPVEHTDPHFTLEVPTPDGASTPKASDAPAASAAPFSNELQPQAFPLMLDISKSAPSSDDGNNSYLETPISPRSRLESTASSMFFPGGWFSKVPQGRASLDVAQGEFTPSKPTTPSVTAPTEDSESEEKKGKWCVVM
ncbi:hypothetical protein B0H10DRAFT_2216541 [Mycena sp. CBHHK59/15]|nr:hypothetical protein B0H10DRAFT_2216541 [Mycena sp. CBHHK59/15]